MAIDRDCATPLYGRTHELAVLQQVRRDAHRYGRCCFIAGAPGIGKSRLLKQFLNEVPRGRSAVGVGRALQHVRSPFAPWLGAFAAAVPAAAAALRPNAHDDKLTMYGAVVDALRSSAERRMTIVAIEDLHWADAASIELLHFLATQVPAIRRLLLLCTLRIEEAEESLRAAIARPEPLLLELSALDEKACSALVRALLPNEEPDSARVTRIAALCAGNPFFAEELCDNAASSDVPLSLQTAIGNTLSRLSERERRVLEVAALLGERFDLAFLSEMLRLPAATIAQRLEKAQVAGIVLEEPDGTLRFRHALVREVLTGGITTARRIQIHERAARALERHPAGDALACAQLAYHYAGARDRRKAYAYNMRAGSLAYGVHAYADAAKSYGDAVAAAPAGSLEYARALQGQADALFRTRAIAEAEGAYAKAISVYRAVGLIEDAAKLSLSLARTIFNQDRPRDALAVVESAAPAEAQLPGHLRAGLQLQGAFCAAEFDPALARTWLNGLDESRVMDTETFGTYCAVRGAIDATVGDVDDFRSTLERFLQRVQGPQHNGEYVGHFGNLAANALFLGCSATALYDRCLTLARRLDMQVYEAAYASHAAYDRWLHGDTEGFARLLRIARSVDAPIPALRSYLLTGKLLEDPSFVPPLDEVYALIAGGHNEFFGPLAGLCAHRLASRGDTKETQRILDAAADVLARPYAAWETLIAMIEIGSAQARERAHTLLARCRESAAPAFAATAAFADALYAQREGDQAARDAAAARARSLYREMRWVNHARRVEVVQPAAAAPRLSEREEQIAMLLRQGRTNRAMAAELFISEKTVEKHVARLFEKLHVNNRAAAVQALSQR